MKDSYNVIYSAAVDRNPRESLFGRDLKGIGIRCIIRNGYYLLPVSHDLGYFLVIELEHIVDHLPLGILDIAALGTDIDHHPDLFLGHFLVVVVGIDLKQSEDAVRGSSQKLDERLVAKYMSDKTPGAPVILQWIQNGACQDVKKTIEQNLIGIALGSARVVPCYNFCIVVPTSRNKSANNEVSIAWYTCHSDISEAGGTVDSYITVYANDKSHEDADIKNGLVRAYLGLIEDTGGARERLNEFGSRIFEFDPDKK